MRALADSEAKGVAMIAELNRLIDVIEEDLAEDLDVAEFVARIGTTE